MLSGVQCRPCYRLQLGRFGVESQWLASRKHCKADPHRLAVSGLVESGPLRHLTDMIDWTITRLACLSLARQTFGCDRLAPAFAAYRVEAEPRISSMNASAISCASTRFVGEASAWLTVMHIDGGVLKSNRGMGTNALPIPPKLDRPANDPFHDQPTP